MHFAVKKFISEIKKDFSHKFRLRKVLDVGSHDINGSVRKNFWFCKYIGVDISKGKGVDIVGEFTDVILPISKFDVVLSVECLEHNSEWEKTLLKMFNVLEIDGLMIVTCAGPDRPEHGTKRTTPNCSPDTTDYYKNITIEEFEKTLPRKFFSEYVLQYSRGKNDLQFYGIKKNIFNRKVSAKEIYSKLLENNKFE